MAPSLKMRMLRLLYAVVFNRMVLFTMSLLLWPQLSLGRF